MDDLTRERASDLFSALSNPVRLRITELLIDREMSVGEVAAELEISLSGASQHLAQLARVGILAAEAKGTTRIYRVRGPRIGMILGLIEEFCHIHGLYGGSDA